jgi:hypothetical protein
MKAVSCPVCGLKCEGGLEAFLHALQRIGDAAHKERALQLARSGDWDERPPNHRGAFA